MRIHSDDACRRYKVWLHDSICGPEAIVLRANIHKNAKCYLQASIHALGGSNAPAEIQAMPRIICHCLRDSKKQPINIELHAHIQSASRLAMVGISLTWWRKFQDRAGWRAAIGFAAMHLIY